MSAVYSASAAKLKAMYAGALGAEELKTLTEMKTVREICAYLKSTAAYGSALASIDENDAHRGMMEFLMQEKLFDDFMKIYKFIDKRDSEAIEYFLVRREIEFLKREIHYIYTGERRSDNELTEGKFERIFKSRTKIDGNIMKTASSLEDCIEACKNTQYEAPLTRALNIGADFFTLGMILDDQYYRNLWSVIHKKVPKGEVSGLERLIGSSVDMLNIMWIYRGKKYFGFDKEIIFAYILPVRYRLNDDAIRALVNAQTAAEVAETAQKTPYGELFNGVDDGLFVEENYMYMVYKTAKSIFTMHPDSLAAVWAYVKLREWEIWRITTVIEGVRYGKSPEFIQKHIKADERE